MVAKTVSFMLLSGPYGSQMADHCIRIAQRALDNGYNVKIFLYGEGVHAQMSGQLPKAFLNIGESLKQLSQKGAEIISCSRCSQARGYIKGEFSEKDNRYPSEKALDEVRILSLYGYIDQVKASDKVLCFGGL